MRRFPRVTLTVLAAFLTVSVGVSHVQFKEEAFTQTYNDDPSSDKDSIDVMFSFKEFFGGVTHKNELKIGTMFAGSTVFVGTAQMYNRQYWKLPVIYGGLAATAGAGIWYRSLYAKEGLTKYKQASNWCFAGAGVVWWASLMDGVLCYKPNVFPQPGRATLYSILVPGLG